MIAACPNCSARYRVDSEKIGPDGARLRCAKCEAVFRVRVPEAPAAPVAAVEPPRAAAPPEPAAPTPAASAVSPLVTVWPTRATRFGASTGTSGSRPSSTIWS